MLLPERYSAVFSCRVSLKPSSSLKDLISLFSSALSRFSPRVLATLPLAEEIYRALPAVSFRSLNTMEPPSTTACTRSWAFSLWPLLKVIFCPSSFWLMSPASTSASVALLPSSFSLVLISSMAFWSVTSLKLMFSFWLP